MDIARVFLILLGLCFWPGHGLRAQSDSPIKLWVGVSVDKPVYSQAESGEIQVTFAVVNDGHTTVNPEIGGSHLFINGVEPENWSFIIGNGPRTSDFDALPSGEKLLFVYQLGNPYFLKPGIYTLRWETRNFRSAETAFRVMPPGH